MEERGLTELELRAMLEQAVALREGQVEGRFIAEARHRGKLWVVVLEPDFDLECVTRRRLFKGAHEAESIALVLTGEIASPNTVEPTIPRLLDAPIMHALERDQAARTPSARDFARELAEAAVAAGIESSHAEVAAYVEATIGATIAERRATLKGARARNAARPSAPSLPELSDGRVSAGHEDQETATLDAPRVAVALAAPPSRPTSRSRGWLYGTMAGGLLAICVGLVAVAAFRSTAPKPLGPEVKQPVIGVASSPDPASAQSVVAIPDTTLPSMPSASTSAPRPVPVPRSGKERVPPNPYKH
jgi:hypothetical protein